MLNTLISGDLSAGRPLIIAHGLFGSGRNWGAISKRLSKTRPVIAVDMRNHGQSFHAETQSYYDMAGDLAEVVAAHGGTADILGHSMGGKAAMVLALQHPEYVSRLIVADIAPVGYTHTQLPLIDAMEALDLSTVTARRDADVALQSKIPEPATRAFLIQSLDLSGDAPVWRLNLPALRNEMPSILNFPAIDGEFSKPTLFLTGEKSDYVRAEHRAKIQHLFPDAEFETIAGVGHWLHAEAPGPFIEKTAEFLGGN